jgi:YD repeat-containing protein
MESSSPVGALAAFPPLAVLLTAMSLRQCSSDVEMSMNPAPDRTGLFIGFGSLIDGTTGLRRVVGPAHAILAVCLTTLASVAFAQAPPVAQSGFQANRDYLSFFPWESIDTASGNVVLTFTDLELKGNNGRSLRFVRTFNNTTSLWSTAHGTKWTFGIAGVPMRVEVPNYAVGQVFRPPATEFQDAPRFYFADGSIVNSWFAVEPDSSTASTLAQTTRSFVTADFSRYDRFARYLWMPDGTTAQYDDQGRLEWIFDRFGNSTSLQWSAPVAGLRSLVIWQNLGSQSRRVDIVLRESTQLPVSISFDGREWTYSTNASDAGRLDAVQPPGGRPWQYQYVDSGFGAGNVHQVTTPQGGTVRYEYDWKTFVFVLNPDGTPASSDQYFTLVGRTTNSGSASGTWVFDYVTSGPGGALAGMIAISPDSSAAPSRRVEYGYSGDVLAIAGGFRLVGVSVFEGASSVPAESESRTYENVPAVRAGRGFYVPQVKRRTVSRNSQAYEIENGYNLADTGTFANFHRPSQVTERSGGQERRRTNLNYQHLTSNPYILALPTLEQTIVGSESVSRGWTYDSTTGFKTSETAQGSVTTFTADDDGNVLRVTKANDKWTEFTYVLGQVTSTRTELGFGVTRGINADSTVQWESQAGRTTTYQYDDLMRVRQVEGPGGTVPASTDYEELTFGQRITVRRGPAGAGDTPFVRTTTDGFGRPIETENAVGVKTRITYDAEGRKVFESLPFQGTPSPIPGTTFAYDVLGRVIRETNADNTYRQRIYGVDTGSGLSTVRVADENGNETTLRFRPFGDPDDGLLVGVRDADNREWSYTYNVLGALKQVSSPDGITRTWTYAPETLRLEGETHPESGTVVYTYDAAGVLATRRDANGVTTIYEYDDNDRVVQIRAGGLVTSIDYEPGSDKRVRAIRGGVESLFFYDTAGRLRARDDLVDGRGYTRRFEYDTRDNVRFMTYPSGRRVEYTYDTENRINGVYDRSANQTVADNFQYHPSGALTQYRAGNDLTTNINYKPLRYWVESITVGPLQLGYAYHDNGNVQTISDQRAGHSQNFQYDVLDRLTFASATVSQGASSFSYDIHGNRTGGDYEYQPGTLRLVRQGTRTFTYDDNGNMKTEGPNVTLNYAPDNMMSSAVVSGVTTVYDYDADQWRIRKAGPTSTTHYLRGGAGELLTEVTDLGTGLLETRDHIYAGSRLLAAVTSSMPGSICTATIAPAEASVAAAGGPLTVTVTIAPGCAWTAVSTEDWITVTAGASGTGNGSVSLSVASYAGAANRIGNLVIAGRPFVVTQSGSTGCIGTDRLFMGDRLYPGQCLRSGNGLFRFEYNAVGQVVLIGPSGTIRLNGHTPGGNYAEMQDGRFVVFAPSGAIDWQVGTPGYPNAYLVVQDDRNVVIYDGTAQNNVLWHWETHCTYVPAPLYALLPYTGGARTVTVQAQQDCPWTTVSPESWVVVTAGASGSGDGTAQISVAQNNATHGRGAAVAIAAHTLAVEQAGGPGEIESDYLYPGERIYASQWLRSQNGVFRLSMSENGNLTLSSTSGGLWTSGTTPGYAFLEMLNDGRLAIIDTTGTIRWDSGTIGNPGAYLRVTDSGQVIIYSSGGSQLWVQGASTPCTYDLQLQVPIVSSFATGGTVTLAAPDHCVWSVSSSESWASITSSTSGVGSATISFEVAENSSSTRFVTFSAGGQSVTLRQGNARPVTNVMYPGEELYAGQLLRSANEEYTLVYQGDGNLVITGPSGVIWHSHTHGTVPGFLAMQGDGNLVLYHAYGGVAFHTSTNGNDGAFVVLQDDGNLVVYQAGGGQYLWASFEHP